MSEMVERVFPKRVRELLALGLMNIGSVFGGIALCVITRNPAYILLGAALSALAASATPSPNDK